MNTGEIKEKIKSIGFEPRDNIRVFTDTTNFISIDRDDVIQFPDKAFLVTGNAREGRFGIDEQPKFWVKKAIDISDGTKKIIKLVFNEEMTSSFGPFTFKSIRSGEKEGKVLDLNRNDKRFMQGYTQSDSKYNQVRIIDLIIGSNLYNFLRSFSNMTHEEYFTQHFPGLFKKFVVSVEAISSLHHEGICHGDIRTDHIFIDKETGGFRWIDFDLKQYVLDFDIWRIGNILMCLVGMGEMTFYRLKRDNYGDPTLFDIREEDASAFFPYRIANLKKIYPYISDELNYILMKYSKKNEEYLDNYKNIDSFLDDLKNLDI